MSEGDKTKRFVRSGITETQYVKRNVNSNFEKKKENGSHNDRRDVNFASRQKIVKMHPRRNNFSTVSEGDKTKRFVRSGITETRFLNIDHYFQ